ncbi:MAG: Na+/H+ antiporter subunit E [Bryobacteraceae bacterium]|nr:Na+/H+ antiporter subunit E [Bryobacteraceae bacterium]
MTRAIRKLLVIAEFLIFFLYELVLANLRLAKDSLRPTRDLRPGIIAVPLDLETAWQIIVLSNLITLTPGTLSLDVSPDGKVIYVHAMDASDIESVRSGIKRGLERRVKELFS